MPINVGAVGTTTPETERRWTSKEALLYALGVGAGALDPAFELEFTTENSTGHEQRVLPAFAVIIGQGGAGGGSRGLSPLAELGEFDPAMLVHGEQAIEVDGPIPAEGSVRTTSRIAGVYDKGSGALVVIESASVDAETGNPAFRLRTGLFIRGEGGFGGERGPSGARNQAPEREPDHVVTYTTRPDQALLYRLSGDRNPLHSDPEFAKRAGFDRPILHGLCTYGFTARALLHGLCGSDPARFRTMQARFSRPVFPGESLTVSMWVDGKEAVFRTETEPGHIVLDGGRFTFD
jgi:acyl dehydratase